MSSNTFGIKLIEKNETDFHCSYTLWKTTRTKVEVPLSSQEEKTGAKSLLRRRLSSQNHDVTPVL